MKNVAARIARFLLEFDIDYDPRMDRLFERDDFLFDVPKSVKPKSTLMKAPEPDPGEDEGDEEGVTRREYARDVDTAPTVAHLNRQNMQVGLAYPNFRQYQPEIAQFSQANANNMAACLIFVICSQGVSWHNLTVWFPEIIDYIRRPRDYEGNKKSGLTPFPKGVPWGQAVVWGRESIDFIWTNRGKIYDSIMKAVQEDNASGNTGFFTYAKLCAIPGLGIPKAGFASQLISGRHGCVDSVNLVVHGGPTELLSPGGGFKNPKAWIKPERSHKDDRLAKILYGKLTARGESMLKAYADYLNKLKHEDADSATEDLWDTWCSITASKIMHGGKNAAIDVELGHGRKSRVLAYNDAGDYSGVEGGSDGELDLDDQRDYSKLTPRAQNLRKAKSTIHRTRNLSPGQLVGQQHRDMIRA